jgi:hypothetical protein
MSEKKHLHVLGELSAHPIARTIEWSDLIPALSSIGLLHEEKNGNYHFERNGHSLVIEHSNRKVVDIEEVLKLRHFLLLSATTTSNDSLEDAVIIAIDYHQTFICHNPDTATETRLIVHADLQKARKVHSHPTNAPFSDSNPTLDNEYSEAIIAEIINSSRIVILAHGTGSSNASVPLLELLHQKHPELAHRVVAVMKCDLGSMSEGELVKAGTVLLTNTTNTSH